MIEIKKTDQIIEYKHFCFVEVSKVLYDGILSGWYYEDKSGKKSWYMIFFYGKEDELYIPDDCSYGEDCIYCHDEETAKELCKTIRESHNAFDLLDLLRDEILALSDSIEKGQLEDCPSTIRNSLNIINSIEEKISTKTNKI